MGQIGAAVEVRALSISCSGGEHEFRQQGYHQQALYCFRKLCQLSPSNVNGFWDRASLAKEVGELRTVRETPSFPVYAIY